MVDRFVSPSGLRVVDYVAVMTVKLAPQLKAECDELSDLKQVRGRGLDVAHGMLRTHLARGVDHKCALGTAVLFLFGFLQRFIVAACRLPLSLSSFRGQNRPSVGNKTKAPHVNSLSPDVGCFFWGHICFSP